MTKFEETPCCQSEYTRESIFAVVPKRRERADNWTLLGRSASLYCSLVKKVCSFLVNNLCRCTVIVSRFSIHLVSKN
jgi:hypothetical protein